MNSRQYSDWTPALGTHRPPSPELEAASWAELGNTLPTQDQGSRAFAGTTAEEHAQNMARYQQQLDQVSHQSPAFPSALPSAWPPVLAGTWVGTFFCFA